MKIKPKIAAGAAALTLALILATAAFTGCSSVTGKIFDAYGYFGTLSTVAVYADYNNAEESDNVAAAITEIKERLAGIENAVGATNEESDIFRFNAAAPGEKLEIEPSTYELLKEAKRLYEYTGGNYNPAVGNLVDLWGFTPRFDEFDYEKEKPYDRDSADSLPDEKYIDAFRTLTNFGQVSLVEENGIYNVTKPDTVAEVDGEVFSMSIDLGGIGKGYAADAADRILEERGLNYSYVSVGTSSLRLRENYKTESGAPASNMWRVSIAHPRTSGSYLSVYAKNEAASTSGDYERYFIKDGKRYCHIIDPTTGRPAAGGIATVSVFGRTAAEGDALSTAIMIMGLEKAIGFINEKLTDCKVGLVYYNETADRYEFITNMEKADYSLSDGSIKICSETENERITYAG